MMKKIEDIGKTGTLAIVDSINDPHIKNTYIGAVDIALLESLIKEIKARDPIKRGGEHIYRIAIRESEVKYPHDRYTGCVLLFQKHVVERENPEENTQEERDRFYALAPCIIPVSWNEKGEEKKPNIEWLNQALNEGDGVYRP